MGAAVLIVTAIAAAASMYARYKQGQAEQQLAENNAQISAWRAADATRRGVEAAAMVEAEGARIAEAGVARAAASGVGVADGSAADAEAASLMYASEDAAQARANAAREAWGMLSQAQDYATRGRLAKQAAGFSMAATGLRASGSILGGIYKATN